MVKTHTVQKARISGFLADDKKVRVANFCDKNVDKDKPECVFYIDDFYPPELEKKLQKLESVAYKDMKIISKNDRPYCELRRDAFNQIRKYALVQTYRTEHSLKVVNRFLKQDRMEIHKRDMIFHQLDPDCEHDIKEYATRLLWEIIETSWYDLKQSSFSLIRNDYETFNNLYPVILKSYSEDFILSDTGFAVEQSIIDDEMFSLSICDFEKTFDLIFTDEQIRSRSKSSWFNYLQFPIDYCSCMLLVDDIWRIAFYETLDYRWFRLFGIRSRILDLYNIPPFIIINGPALWSPNNNRIRSGSLESNFRDDDLFLIFPVEISPDCTAFLNHLSIQNSDSEIVFKDNKRLCRTDAIMRAVCEEGLSDKDISFIMSYE